MTEERFDEFMNQLRQHSFYNTESWPEYGDQLIILSTCSYYTENGRFVVVARRVEQRIEQQVYNCARAREDFEMEKEIVQTVKCCEAEFCFIVPGEDS